MELIEGKNRESCLDLFRDVPQWKAFIHSAIEDGIEHMFTDNPNNPTVAILFYGGIVIYAGEPELSIAKEAVKVLKVQPAVLAYSSYWNDLLEEIYKDRIKIETRYYLPFSSHNRNRLKEILAATKSNIREITESDYNNLQQILGWQHQEHHFKDSQDFINNGMGFVIEEDNQIKAGASAFCRSKKYAECQVNTVEEYRKTGMATAVSAAFIENCYNNDVKISWDAANEISVRLGQKLGFEEVLEYNTYSIFHEKNSG